MNSDEEIKQDKINRVKRKIEWIADRHEMLMATYGWIDGNMETEVLEKYQTKLFKRLEELQGISTNSPYKSL